MNSDDGENGHKRCFWRELVHVLDEQDEAQTRRTLMQWCQYAKDAASDRLVLSRLDEQDEAQTRRTLLQWSQYAKVAASGRLILSRHQASLFDEKDEASQAERIPHLSPSMRRLQHETKAAESDKYEKLDGLNESIIRWRDYTSNAARLAVLLAKGVARPKSERVAPNSMAVKTLGWLEKWRVFRSVAAEMSGDWTDHPEQFAGMTSMRVIWLVISTSIVSYVQSKLRMRA